MVVFSAYVIFAKHNFQFQLKIINKVLYLLAFQNNNDNNNVIIVLETFFSNFPFLSKLSCNTEDYFFSGGGGGSRHRFCYINTHTHI